LISLLFSVANYSSQSLFKSKIEFCFLCLALAFLAFAGYLLCMIVQAIKSKGTMYLHPNSVNYMNGGANTMNNLINTGSVPLRKRRPIGRKKRNLTVSPFDNYNNTEYSTNLTTFTPEDMYFPMIQCAENYNQFYLIQ
jgi:hypothetical protein